MQHYLLSRWRNACCRFLLVLALFRAQTARAEGGELSFHIMSGQEVARLSHPDDGFARSPVGWVYIPRLGLHAEYGVTHAWHIGVGAEYAFNREVRFVGVAPLSGGQGELIGDTQSVFIPITLAYHFTHGSDWSATVRGYAGISLASWGDEVLYRSGPQIDARSQRLPLDTGRFWVRNWHGRIEALADWRPNALFGVAAGPYVTCGLQGDLALGLSLQARLQWGAGPYL